MIAVASLPVTRRDQGPCGGPTRAANESKNIRLRGARPIDLLQLAAIYHPGGPRRLIDRLNRAQAKAAGKAGLTVERIVGELAPVCLSSCVPSSRFLPADSAAGRFWNWRTSPSVTSCTFFAANGRVSPGCSRTGLSRCRNPVQNGLMIYGYAWVSTDGQSVDAQPQHDFEAPLWLKTAR